MTRKRRRGRPPHDDQLTPAEWRIAHAVRHGMSAGQMARRRGISLDAIKFHMRNILGKLGLAERAALRQWRGVPRDSALARAAGNGKSEGKWDGVGDGNMADRDSDGETGAVFGALGQIARSVADVAASEAWYRDVLGLPHLYTFGDLAFFDCAGTRLMLSAAGEGGGAESILYFRVDDIAAAHDLLAGRGAEFLGAPHMIHRHADGTEEWMAFFKDNEGRPLAIMSQVRA